VNDAIAGLIRLQEMDTALEALRQGIGRVSPRRAEILARRMGASAVQENSKKALIEAQVNRKNQEIEIETKEQDIRKHSSQLNSVKSNDAYKALIREIDSAKKAKVLLEDDVLVLMEKIEVLQKEAKTAESEAQRISAELDGQSRELDQEEAALKAQVDSKKTERDEFAETLPGDARARYEAIQRGRPGFMAVVPVNAMVCGGCRTGLTPNLVNQVMKEKEIVTCEGCSRILFIVPKPPVPDVPVSGDSSSLVPVPPLSVLSVGDVSSVPPIAPPPSH
jgi:predicted  nucleic acid-binding Zn-ribbon protein